MTAGDKKNTDVLIKNLSEDLKPCGYKAPMTAFVAWIVFALAYLIAAIAFFGLRPDFSEILTDSAFSFETMMAFAIFITAAKASAYLRYPDICQKEWVKTIPSTLFGAFLIWALARSVEEGISPAATFAVGRCATEGLWLEIIPFLTLIYLTARAWSTQPYWAIFMNVLCVSALGWLGLHLTCSMDDMGHFLMNHFLPFAVLGAAIGMFARRIFKW
jgi:hypothetical protein